MDLMQPNLQSSVMRHQDQQKLDHDRHVKDRTFNSGDLVHARNFSQGSPWLPRVIEEPRGPVSYTVKLEDCLLYTSPSPRDATLSRMPSSA